MAKYIDITGQKFGKITVIEMAPVPEGKRGTYWHCICDCGNESILNGASLRRGYTKSCSQCRPRKYLDLTGKKFNRLTVIEKAEAKTKAGGFMWRCICDCGNECIVSSDKLVNRNQQSCGCLKHDKEVAAERLTKVGGTYAEFLTSKIPKNNKTGYKGIEKRKENSSYRAGIGLAGKWIHLGTFDTFEEALAARKKAEEMYHKPLLEEAEIIRKQKGQEKHKAQEESRKKKK